MTMLARLTEVTRRARMRGDWDDERVILEMLAEMRASVTLMHDMLNAGARESGSAKDVWQAMIDVIRAEATEPAQMSELERE
jgi:hypothetical protein